MDDVDAANKDKISAKRNFTRARKSLSNAIDSREDVDIIKRRYNSFKEKWTIVQEKYETWMKFQENYDDEAVVQDETWIEDLENKFDNLERDYINFIRNEKREIEEFNLRAEALEVNKKIAETQKAYLIAVERSREKRLVEQKAFYGQCDHILNAVSDVSSSVSSLQMLQTEFKEQFQRCKVAHSALLEILNEDDIKSEVDWIAKVQEEYLGIIKKGTAYIDGKLEAAAKPEMKLERMKLPTFNGDIRSFPRFKTDFNKYVKPRISTDSCPYILKTCLIGSELQDLVRNVDDDIVKMWERLDEKYGQASKLVEVILKDIRSIKPINHDNDMEVISFINMLEAGYRDLKMIKCEHEFSNTTVISLIESKLPRDVRREWAKEINKKRDTIITDNKKFEKLLDFLIELRGIVEYDLSAVRNQEVRNPQTKNNQTQQRCLIHNSDRHSSESCSIYQDKSSEERLNLIKEKNACLSCLRIGHRISECWFKKRCGVNNCGKDHHESLHGAYAAGYINHSCLQDYVNSSVSCLLPIMSIKASLSENLVNVLFDGGSTISLITFSAAKRLGLRKVRKVMLSVVKVGGEVEEIESCEYKVCLDDLNGATVFLKAYGISKITSKLDSGDLGSILKLFKNVSADELQRPTTGEIDLLMGFEYAAYHPRYIENVGHLVLMKNRFGKCVGGSSECLKEGTSKVIVSASINLAMNKGISDFVDLESLGVECTPRCGACRCGNCPIGGKELTLKEEREVKLIESGLHYENCRWIAHYPWKRNPKELPDNYQMAFQILRSTERRLLKNEAHAQQYSNQINEMIENKVARRLTEREMEEYDGPIHYVSHHDVIKPNSNSTPMRIVFNSSANYKGNILNDYWAKGPDMLNNLLGVLLRFREKEIGVVGDITRMYHSVRLAFHDQHTHRFLWRNLDLTKPPQIYVMLAVSFGDRPAGCIAMLALKKTAEMSRSYSEEAYQAIVDNTYVDDIVDGAKSKSLARKLSRSIEESLEKGGFKCKDWTYSFEGKSDLDLSNDDMSLDQRVLGMRWNSLNDYFHFVVRFNFSVKKRGIRTGPDLTKKQIELMVPEVLTKRHIYSQVNAIFDPMGLVVPVTVRAKILIRKHFTNSEVKKGWDDPLPLNQREEWIEFFKDVFDLENISFKRCIKPANATDDDPILIIFSDASESAYGTCAYVRWALVDGGYSCTLLGGKSKSAPVKRVSIVRLELNAALLAKRFTIFISREMRLHFSRQYFIIDSEIVLSMLHKDSYNFDTYAGVRVGEIQQSSELGNWFWVDGNANIADWITRGKLAFDIGEISYWQKGPDFLYAEEHHWPIKRARKTLEIPVPLKAIVSNLQLADIEYKSDIIDLERFSNYTKLVRCMARVLQVFKGNTKPSLKNISKSPTTEELTDAQKYLARRAQSSMIKEIQNGKFERLSLMKGSEGEYLVGRKSKRWLQFSYDKHHVMLLPYNHRFSWLYVQFIHGISHHGVATTVAKIRLRYWIVNVSKMVKAIIFKCIPCRIERKKCLEQIMSPLPIERLKPTPPFFYTSLDYFGPFAIKGEVNKRIKGKCFGVIFTGMVSRPVHLDVAVDYSTNSFLSVMRRFVSIRGYPKKIYSDNGSQLVKASKELKVVLNDLDWKEICLFGADNGLEWSFSPADAPWYNGCAEALIKSTKRALHHAIGPHVLTFSDLQTVFFEVANLLNERPIGRHPTSPDEGHYICPNALLLGRATIRVPGGPFKSPTSQRQRFEFVQAIVDNYWKRMMRDYFPSLIVEAKWHVARRNVHVGDVVLVQDNNAIRGFWRMAIVCKTLTDADGYVRQCEVKYKTDTDKPTSHYTILKRPVQRLVVIIPFDES